MLSELPGPIASRVRAAPTAAGTALLRAHLRAEGTGKEAAVKAALEALEEALQVGGAWLCRAAHHGLLGVFWQL